MKIQAKASQAVLDVFALYWDSEGKTFFLTIEVDENVPYVYSADEVTLLDTSFPFRTIYLPNHLRGIFHWALIERELLDELIDGNPAVRQEFLDIVRKEKAIDW